MSLEFIVILKEHTGRGTHGDGGNVLAKRGNNASTYAEKLHR